jgi:hypothetical protein
MASAQDMRNSEFGGGSGMFSFLPKFGSMKHAIMRVAEGIPAAEALMRLTVFIVAIGLIAELPSRAVAGMPMPLPPYFQPERILRLDDSALSRLQAISFFIVVFLLAAKGIQWLWNYFRRDFSALPRLSFGRALAGLFLWALLFVIVLTMISGARELMTPGAWVKRGATYRLAAEPATATFEPDPESARRQHLEKLRTALWQFAATHQGRFPAESEKTAIAGEFWDIPDSGGMRYLYVQGLAAGHVPEILAYEPELVSGRRLVLKTTGDILIVPSAEIPKRPIETDNR